MNPGPIATQGKGCPRPPGNGGPASKETCSHSAARSMPASPCLHSTSLCHQGQTGLTRPGQGPSDRAVTSTIDSAFTHPGGCMPGSLSQHRHSTKALADVLTRCPAAERHEESRTLLLTKETWMFARLPLLRGHCEKLALANSGPSLPSLALRLPPRGLDSAP